MRILIAPNAFKNSLSATAAATAIAEGLRQSSLPCETSCIGIGDGGDGTGGLIAEQQKAKWIEAIVNDPLGREIRSGFYLTGNHKTAIIELADAAGLRLLEPGTYNPLRASSFGAGQLIVLALDKQVENIILCIGGSATVDGGVGILLALGMRFLDQNQNLITDLPAYLLSLKSIELDQLDQRIFRIKLVILCDVDNTMLGNEGAARVFGPQKGASEQAVTLLEERLCHWNRIVLEKTGKDLSTLIHGGAAGGMAASMQALLGAELKAGIDYFLDNCGFDELLQESDLLITGEGSIDSQSIKGKAPVGAARRAKRKGIPVIALAGSIPPEPDGELQEIFDALFSINPGIISIQEALAGTAANLKRTACNLGDLLAMGKAFGSLSAK